MHTSRTPRRAASRSTSTRTCARGWGVSRRRPASSAWRVTPSPREAVMSDSQTEAFHAGERALQARAGVAERLARLGPQVIRDHMPEQHRDFFALLPFIVVGSIDERHQPTASLLAAPPGFVSSPDPKTLRIDALAREDDPLHENLRPGAPLAVLGIQPHTRRRNRANGS